MYPRKVGKELAKKTWKKLKPDAELFGEIIAAVGRAKTSGQWQRDGGRFIPNPATWLNQGRWEDELTPLQPLVQPVVTGFDPAGMVGFKNALDRYDKLAEVADEAVRE